MPNYKVLLVEDDKNANDIIRYRLAKDGYLVTGVFSGTEAISRLETEEYELILLDLKLPDINGLDLLPKLKEMSTAEVIIVTASNSVEVAVEAITMGAVDYVKKPIDFERMKMAMKRAVEKSLLTRQELAINKLVSNNSKFPEIIAYSKTMKTVLESVDRAAASNSPIIIYGETGTGKDLIARTIHLKSDRCWAPLVAVNCANLSERLLERELFGYEKEENKGTDKLQRGSFEVANHGTIFLDEICQTNLAVQYKLVRTLEAGEFKRVNGRSMLSTDIRVIVGSSQKLEKLMEKGKFRPDLYHSLKSFVISVPSLNERKEDIKHLAKYFLDVLSKDSGKKRKFTDAALQILEEYSWPGNVREMRNLVERLIIICNSDVIDIDNLPVEIKTGKSQ
ncbi:MAG: sigma-54-dependent Fis family transcriptional regulator [Planctomycetes bacterium]|nr:sigma-54-dependent Fis family transcriptional regulator [Planctomycetota bacterium]